MQFLFSSSKLIINSKLKLLFQLRAKFSYFKILIHIFNRIDPPVFFLFRNNPPIQLLRIITLPFFHSSDPLFELLLPIIKQAFSSFYVFQINIQRIKKRLLLNNPYINSFTLNFLNKFSFKFLLSRYYNSSIILHIINILR